jgi:Holliday junction DNA helicase RuvA
MIATLTGTVTEKNSDLLVIDVAGIGYGVMVSSDDWSALQNGSIAKLYIYEHIREQSYDLFGFISIQTKQLFEQLLGVNGVGPKMALAVLSVGNESEVRLAIAEGNIKFLQTASGVGKKVAERIVVDLKDKLGVVASEGATTFLQTPSVNSLDEAQQALVALGFSAQDAVQALAGVPGDLPVEERIKQALKGSRL